ncbi:31772_t:CDS:1, partial [Racocetra persica]
MFWDHKNNMPSVVVTNLEHLQKCTGQSIVNNVIAAIINHGLEPKKCQAW